jgi:hypothetical protein
MMCQEFYDKDGNRTNLEHSIGGGGGSKSLSLPASYKDALESAKIMLSKRTGQSRRNPNLNPSPNPNPNPSPNPNPRSTQRFSRHNLPAANSRSNSNLKSKNKPYPNPNPNPNPNYDDLNDCTSDSSNERTRHLYTSNRNKNLAVKVPLSREEQVKG